MVTILCYGFGEKGLFFRDNDTSYWIIYVITSWHFVIPMILYRHDNEKNEPAYTR